MEKIEIVGKKFEGGEVVATNAVCEDLEISEITILLTRHFSADWGNVCKEDKRINDEAIKNEGNADLQDRVISEYVTSDGERIWIITEWDRSYTTLLYPEEY